MLRRDFIKLTAALGAASALPLWSRAARAADRPALPVPPLLTPDAQGKIALALQAGKPAGCPAPPPKPGIQRRAARAGGEAAAWPAGNG